MLKQVEDALARMVMKSYEARKKSGGKQKLRMCVVCDAFPDPYMVKPEVWAHAGFPRDVLVCLSCLEKAFGRPLVIQDFTEAPINIPIFLGFRMGAINACNEDNKTPPLAPSTVKAAGSCDCPRKEDATPIAQALEDKNRWDVV